MKSNHGTSRFKRSLAAIAVSAVLGMSGFVQAASSTGNVVGSISGVVSNGYTVTISNPETGFSRQISVDQSGNFRFPQLAIGNYVLTLSKGDTVAAKRDVRVSIGSTANAKFELDSSSGIERIAVTGARISAIDLTSADSGLTIGEVEFDRLPVGRDITSISLLAPGTVKGEGAFGNLASFSGSSVAENVCYINGMNVTDPDKGLGCGTVPFEFYKEFQVKTGGYSAQYGRATGGVINAVTKSGTNEFEFGATAYYTPDFLGDGTEIKSQTGRVYRDTTQNYSKNMNATFSAGGPIIKDNLFFFAMYNPRKVETGSSNTTSRTAGPTSWSDIESDDAFWGGKLDWDINDSHRLSYFGYSDEQVRTQKRVSYNSVTKVKNASNAKIYPIELLDGGDTSSLTYTGNFSDSFNLSAMIGRFKTQSSTSPQDNTCPGITDNRPNPSLRTCGSGAGPNINKIKRDVVRLDFEWSLNENHLVRFGYDKEDIEADHTTSDPGGAFYTYNTIANSALIQGTNYTNNTGAAHDYVEKRIFQGGGVFSTDNYAYYIEDQWTINEQWFVTAGLRSDVSENKGKTGITFVKLDNQYAPRLGVTFDPNADGSSKVFANFGKYFFPVPINTNYRTASGISDVTEFYRFTGVDAATAVPQNLALLDTRISSSGEVPDPGLSAAPEYSAQSVSEYTLGYQRELSDEYTATIRTTYRTTNNMSDDYCDIEVDPTGGGGICTQFNPGKGHTFGKDENHDGKIDPGSLKYYTAEQIGIPEGKRDYSSVELGLAHSSENFNWTAQYVWSHSYGNNEGGVNSDNYQSDTGASSYLDFKASSVGANGNLPNDRRHVFKFYGSYALTDAWSIGWNSSLLDGRPKSIRGFSFPADLGLPLPGYGDTYYTYNKDTKTYLFNGRGAMGRMPWVFNLDASVSYAFNFEQLQGRLSMDVFNLLDTKQELALNELGEISSGTPNQFYNLATSVQTPRQVRLGVSIDF